MTAGHPTKAAQNEGQPKVPKSVYSALPRILQDSCSLFSRTIEKEAFLHTALAALTRVLPKSRIVLEDKDHRLALFVYIYGGSTSGKGAAAHALQLLSHLKHREQVENKRMEREYEQALKADSDTAGDPPHMVDIRLPLRTTPSSLLARFDRNPSDTVFLLADTEGHALASPTHKDHGNLREILLKGAEGEEDGQLWKKEGHVNLHVWLSLLITSTPKQMTDGIHSTEDGLFSRFLWYETAGKGGKYYDPRPSGKKSLQGRIQEMAPRVTAIYDLMKESEGVDVTFTEEQYDQHTEDFQTMMTEAHDLSAQLGNFVGRLGKRVLRAAATFALLRKAEDGQRMPRTVVCDELSWHAAELLARVWFESMIKVYHTFNPTAAKEDEDNSAPKQALILIRDYLVQNPTLKPKAVVQKLRQEDLSGLTMWLNQVTNANNSVRQLMNTAKAELEACNE